MRPERSSPSKNGDQLCLARAISVSWAKLNQCTPEEWAEISKTRGKKRNLDLILQHRKVPESFCKKLRTKGRSEQTNLAVAISQLARVALDRPASLNDIAAFESILGVRVMVVSARLGNNFITSLSTDDRPCVYVYQVDDDHFHSITSITGFFCSRYFCQICLKHFDHRKKHRCYMFCIVDRRLPQSR
ncbi:MAG: hypothetical protein N0E61_01050 [Candidatus Thiodiazotropha endolucinida]|nr:hypothetical protein [Candidatus Thiodiazotropha endolucinida]